MRLIGQVVSMSHRSQDEHRQLGRATVNVKRCRFTGQWGKWQRFKVDRHVRRGTLDDPFFSPDAEQQQADRNQRENDEQT